MLADTTDRRRLISGALLAQVAACALLAMRVLGSWGGPASVLFLVFVCGCCTAVLTPAWNSSVVDPVPMRDRWRLKSATAFAPVRSEPSSTPSAR